MNDTAVESGLADQVLVALDKHVDGLTAPELLEHCSEAEGDTMTMGSSIASLRAENRIHWNGELRDQRQVYVLGPKPQQPSTAAPASVEPRTPEPIRSAAPAPAVAPTEEQSMPRGVYERKKKPDAAPPRA